MSSKIDNCRLFKYSASTINSKKENLLKLLLKSRTVLDYSLDEQTYIVFQIK